MPEIPIKKFFWVLQEIRGIYSAYGPFTTKAGAVNRYTKTKGGKITLFGPSINQEPEKVVDEYKAYELLTKGNSY